MNNIFFILNLLSVNYFFNVQNYKCFSKHNIFLAKKLPKMQTLTKFNVFGTIKLKSVFI